LIIGIRMKMPFCAPDGSCECYRPRAQTPLFHTKMPCFSLWNSLRLLSRLQKTLAMAAPSESQEQLSAPRVGFDVAVQGRHGSPWTFPTGDLVMIVYRAYHQGWQWWVRTINSRGGNLVAVAAAAAAAAIAMEMSPHRWRWWSQGRP